MRKAEKDAKKEKKKVCKVMLSTPPSRSLLFLKKIQKNKYNTHLANGFALNGITHICFQTLAYFTHISTTAPPTERGPQKRKGESRFYVFLIKVKTAFHAARTIIHS